MKVLSFGSMNVDHVYHVPHIALPGETIASEAYSVFPGGKGLNQSIALARAGLDVWHAGKLGSQGLFLKELLEENRVHTEFIELSQEPTGHAVIQVDPAGQNSIFLFGGTNRTISPEHIRETLRHFSPGDVLVCQNEINSLEELTEAAVRQGLLLAFNPSPMDGAVTRRIIERASWIYVNETEAQAITGLASEDADRLADALLRFSSRPEWILTLGSKGSCSIRKGEAILKQGIFPVQVADTTAAGDTFSGYHLAAVLQGKSRQEALRRGALAAALAVSRSGASSSIPTLQELTDLAGE